MDAVDLNPLLKHRPPDAEVALELIYGHLPVSRNPMISAGVQAMMAFQLDSHNMPMDTMVGIPMQMICPDANATTHAHIIVWSNDIYRQEDWIKCLKSLTHPDAHTNFALCSGKLAGARFYDAKSVVDEDEDDDDDE